MQTKMDPDASNHKSREILRVTWGGFVTNVALTVVKLIAGLIGHSQALVADAAHSLSDLITDVAVLIGAPFWTSPPDHDHPHGHGRIETLITVFIGAVLAATGFGLGFRAVLSLHEPEPIRHGLLVGAVAFLSMVSKEILFQWTMRMAVRTGSSAVYANAWHHRSDALSSLPVVVVVVLIQLKPEWAFLDPIGALIVAAFILRLAWDIVLPGLQELMDKAAPPATQERLIQIVRATEGVRSMHRLRTRYIGRELQVDMHVQVDPELTVRASHAIAHRVKDRVQTELAGVGDVLIHVEPFDPERHPGMEPGAPMKDQRSG